MAQSDAARVCPHCRAMNLVGPEDRCAYCGKQVTRWEAPGQLRVEVAESTEARATERERGFRGIKLSDLTWAGWLVVLSTVVLTFVVGIPFTVWVINTVWVIKMFPPDRGPKLIGVLIGAPMIVTYAVSLGVGIGVLRLLGLSMTKRGCGTLQTPKCILDHVKDAVERGAVSTEEPSKGFLFSILSMLFGTAGTCWVWYTACFHGRFWINMTLLAPCCFVLGLALLVHQSAGEEKHWNQLDWSARIERIVVVVLGLGAGLANYALLWAYWLTKR
jgi:hypothetical protein